MEFEITRVNCIRDIWLFLLLLCFIGISVFNANSAVVDLGLHRLLMSLINRLYIKGVVRVGVSKLSSESTHKAASVAQLDAPSHWRPGDRGFNPRRGRQHSFVEIDHEIFSTVILSLPLIQEGQLSVSGERMCTILVNRLED